MVAKGQLSNVRLERASVPEPDCAVVATGEQLLWGIKVVQGREPSNTRIMLLACEDKRI